MAGDQGLRLIAVFALTVGVKGAVQFFVKTKKFCIFFLFCFPPFFFFCFKYFPLAKKKKKKKKNLFSVLGRGKKESHGSLLNFAAKLTTSVRVRRTILLGATGFYTNNGLH